MAELPSDLFCEPPAPPPQQQQQYTAPPLQQYTAPLQPAWGSGSGTMPGTEQWQQQQQYTAPLQQYTAPVQQYTAPSQRYTASPVQQQQQQAAFQGFGVGLLPHFDAMRGVGGGGGGGAPPAAGGFSANPFAAPEPAQPMAVAGTAVGGGFGGFSANPFAAPEPAPSYNPFA